MLLQTIGRDCLVLNWALPVAGLPELEPPLRYDVQAWEGEDHVFLSAALFHQQVIDLPKVGFPKVSYPQLCVRLCVLDRDGAPSFYLTSLLLPAWALPSARLVARQPAHSATFDYPQPGAGLEGSPRRWLVKARGRLVVSAAEGGAVAGVGPDLGSWDRTVTYFQRRRRWYFRTADGLGRIEVRDRPQQPVTVSAEVEEVDLLHGCLAAGAADEWPRLHSAWYCSEMPFVFEIGWTSKGSLPRQVPAPG